MPKMYVYQDGSTFYFRNSPEPDSSPRGSFTVPFKVRDFDTDAARNARNWCIQEYEKFGVKLIFD